MPEVSFEKIIKDSNEDDNETLCRLINRDYFMSGSLILNLLNQLSELYDARLSRASYYFCMM